MSAKKIYDLAVVVGSYTKEGQTHNRYLNIGSILEKEDGGKFLLLSRTVNLAGIPNPDNRDTVIVSMFAPKDKSAEDKVKESFQGTTQPLTDDDIPF